MVFRNTLLNHGITPIGRSLISPILHIVDHDLIRLVNLIFSKLRPTFLSSNASEMHCVHLMTFVNIILQLIFLTYQEQPLLLTA